MKQAAVVLIFAALTTTGCFRRDVHPSRTLSGQTLIMGCLNPGGSPDSYVLTDYRTGKPTPVTGHGDLRLHSSNHAVKLIGFYKTETGWEGLRVVRIEHIAAACKTPFPADLPGRAAQHVEGN